MSSPLRTSNNRKRNPFACAARSSSLSCGTLMGLLMLRNAAIAEVAGAISVSNLIRLASKSETTPLSPVRFASGRARLATTRSGSPSEAMTTGIVLVAFLAARRGRAARDDQVDVETNQFGDQDRIAAGIAVG